MNIVTAPLEYLFERLAGRAANQVTMTYAHGKSAEPRRAADPAAAFVWVAIVLAVAIILVGLYLVVRGAPAISTSRGSAFT